MSRSGPLFLWAIASALIALSPTAFAEKRAFVVGIDAYAELPVLSTAMRDAAAVVEVFRVNGFATMLVNEPTLSEFADKWREFVNSLQPGDSAALYFAGHGLQVDGVNYLLLKDTPAEKASDSEILQKSLSFPDLMEQLEARQLAATLYILDACRVSPFLGKSAKEKKGRARGLARIESVYGAFVMYSAGTDEEALDFLVDAKKEGNSVYARRLLVLMKDKDLSILEIAKRVQVQVEQDARSVGAAQHPAYFDGISGQYYLARVDRAGRPLGPTDRIPGENVVRLGGFATWDDNCKSRPAPQIAAAAAPRYGRIVTRYESFTIAGKQFGTVSCEGTIQKGIGVYFVIDDAYRTTLAIERLRVAVKHWGVTPTVTYTETFDVDLPTRFSKRIIGR